MLKKFPWDKMNVKKIPNQARSTNFSFKRQGYCFLPMFRNYTVYGTIFGLYSMTRNFTIFTMYATIFGQFMMAFHFF